MVRTIIELVRFEMSIMGFALLCDVCTELATKYLARNDMDSVVCIAILAISMMVCVVDSFKAGIKRIDRAVLDAERRHVS